MKDFSEKELGPQIPGKNLLPKEVWLVSQSIMASGLAGSTQAEFPRVPGGALFPIESRHSQGPGKAAGTPRSLLGQAVRLVLAPTQASWRVLLPLTRTVWGMDYGPVSTKFGGKAQGRGCGFSLSSSKIKEDSVQELVCGP